MMMKMMLTIWTTLVQPVQKSSLKWWLVALASDTPIQHNVLPERLLNIPQKVTADDDYDNDIHHDDDDVDNLTNTSPACA